MNHVELAIEHSQSWGRFALLARYGKVFGPRAAVGVEDPGRVLVTAVVTGITATSDDQQLAVREETVATAVKTVRRSRRLGRSQRPRDRVPQWGPGGAGVARMLDKQNVAGLDDRRVDDGEVGVGGVELDRVAPLAAAFERSARVTAGCTS